jgi:ATP phosphoribosyltransferase
MNLSIALQKKGRLLEPSLNYLRSKGLEFEWNDEIKVTCSNAAVDLIFVRDDDIPQYVQTGAADFGIVGQNVLLEKDVQCVELEQLGFGECDLVLAVPEEGSIETLSDLQGMRIATSYPVLLRQFLSEKGIFASVIKIEGSVEVAPELNLADAVCDLTQSGRTLKEHKLKVLCPLMKSQSVFVAARERELPWPV